VRVRRTLALAATAALVAACGAGDDGPAAQPPEDQQAPQDPDAPGAEGDDPFADGPELDDPNEQVTDDRFRGEGIVLPVPEGWRVDEMAFAQGLVLAMPEGGAEQFAGQAVDTADLEEDIDLDGLVAANREQFESGPTQDEEVELEGAARAHLLRFDELQPQQEGQPEGSLLLVMADDGDGRIAVFNYAAPTDDYDDDHAELLLSAAGFDPDSEPSPPAPLG
jgi:predicted small lipoprotein YifL